MASLRHLRLGLIVATLALAGTSVARAQSGLYGPIGDRVDLDVNPSISAASTLGDRLLHTGSTAVGSTSVFQSGSVYTLRFVGDETIEYQIDVADPDVSRGLLRVYEKTSDAYLLTVGGACFRTSDGVVHVPAWLKSYTVLTGQSMSGNTVTLDYADTIQGSHRRRHTFQILGKSLRIRIQDLDLNTSYLSNYSGIYTGPTDETEDPRLVTMQGTLATPIVLYQDGPQHYFFAEILDLYWSNASDWQMKQATSVTPGPDSIEFSMHSMGSYNQDSFGQLSAPLDETLTLTVSTRIRDVLVQPTQSPSPYRSLLAPRTVVLFAGNATSWSSYQTHLGELKSWGMDNLACYIFRFWSAGADDPPATLNAGPDWFPATNPTSFKSMVATSLGYGYPIGAYTSFGGMPPTAPGWVNNSTHLAQTDSLAYKMGTQVTAPFPMIAETASAIHAAREASLMKVNYGINLAYVDIATYSGPTKGSDGDHVDQDAASPWAKTLRQACLDRRWWLDFMRVLFEGPVLGEGSIGTQNSNLEWLWSGYCDSVQRTINTAAGKNSSQVPAGNALAVTNWPVIPEFEQRVMAKLQANHGNGFPDRFFGPSDGPAIVDGTGMPIYPLTEPALDRYRAYELTYGHTSFFQTTGPGLGNYTRKPDMVKEYYLVNALQNYHYASPVLAIYYEHQGSMQTFEPILFQTETTNTFKDPRILLVFQNGLFLYVNHKPSNWTVDIGGPVYTLPEDGFLAFLPGTPFLAFSAIPPSGTNGKRIDYCYAPGQYEFFDGRGAVNGYGGINTNGLNGVKFVNFATNVTGWEDATGTMQKSSGVAPAVALAASVPVSATLKVGDSVGLKAIAMFANGAFLNVTTLVSWTSTNSSVATVDSAGAVRAVGKGQATIQAGSYKGKSVGPTTIVVQ